MSPDILKMMRDMGLTIDQAITLLEAMAATPDDTRTAKRARDRDRMREKRVAERLSRDIAATVASDKSPIDPLSRPLPPQTPLTPTHSPESISTQARDAREEPAFGRFWTAYPRREGKAAARKAFAKAWRKLPPFDEEQILIGGLERAKAGWGDAQFIPHAATWLNGERWNDEAPQVIDLSTRKAHERPHHDAKYAARQDNLARHERGAELAARLYGDDG